MTGGFNSQYLNTAELYDVSTNVWTKLNNINASRSFHPTFVLTNDRVFIIGGYGSNGVLNSTELYDPSTSTWSLGPSMNTARVYHIACKLTNGKILVAGGINQMAVTLNSAELYQT